MLNYSEIGCSVRYRVPPHIILLYDGLEWKVSLGRNNQVLLQPLILTPQWASFE